MSTIGDQQRQQRQQCRGRRATRPTQPPPAVILQRPWRLGVSASLAVVSVVVVLPWLVAAGTARVLVPTSTSAVAAFGVVPTAANPRRRQQQPRQLHQRSFVSVQSTFSTPIGTLVARHAAFLAVEDRDEKEKKKQMPNHHTVGKQGDANAKADTNGTEKDADDDWTPTDNGGFLPNLFRRHRRRRRQEKVTTKTSQSSWPSFVSSSTIATPAVVVPITTLADYKAHVVECRDCDFVVVKFYAPWCRACRAIEAPFVRLARRYHNTNNNNNAVGASNGDDRGNDDADHRGQQQPRTVTSKVRFVEVPLTRGESALLHQGLGVPSLPYAHCYHKDVGLVEEMRINQKFFAVFEQTVDTYVQGYCNVTYHHDDDDDNAPYDSTATTANHNNYSKQKGVDKVDTNDKELAPLQ